MEKLIIKKDNNIGWIIFNNQEKHNAINYEMWHHLPKAMEELLADDDIRVIVFRGAGEKFFTAGADLSEFKTLRQNNAASEKYNQAMKGGFQAIKVSPKPLVAMIHGNCIGAGLAIALQCDLRVSSHDGAFGIPSAKRGIAYGYEGIKVLVDLVGAAYAKEILITGRTYDSSSALRMGLIHQLVEKEQLEEFTVNYCSQIAANSPLSIRWAKLAIMEYLKDPQERDMKKLEEEMAYSFDSHDYKEGYTAFLEKRKPNFTGK